MLWPAASEWPLAGSSGRWPVANARSAASTRHRRNGLHLADKAATPLPFSNHVHYCNIQSLRNEIAANKLFTLTF